MQKRKECERQYSEGIPIGGSGGDGAGGSSSGAGSGSGGTTAVTDPEQQRRLLREMQRRTDIVSYALLAEINQFHRDHVLGQMAGHVRQLLRNQIEYYRKVSKTFMMTIYDQCCLNYNHGNAIMLYSSDFRKLEIQNYQYCYVKIVK